MSWVEALRLVLVQMTGKLQITHTPESLVECHVAKLLQIDKALQCRQVELFPVGVKDVEGVE